MKETLTQTEVRFWEWRAAVCLQDTSWLDTYLSDIPHVVYQVDDPEKTVGAQHATLANKGNEAMGYLQFIIDYYDKLPSSIVFLHGHRWPAESTLFIGIVQRRVVLAVVVLKSTSLVVIRTVACGNVKQSSDSLL
jgi:hypothetical protein